MPNKRSSTQSNRSESTVNGTTRSGKSGRPAILDSPLIHREVSSSSLRNATQSRDIPSATPTKIPRIANRPSVPSPTGPGGMPPPAMTTSKSASSQATSRTMTNTSSMADLGRPGVNEFGALGGMSVLRHRTAGSHRAHLLAPMSSRAEPKREKLREPLVRMADGGGVIPPSRRNLPIPPTAPTASSLAKQTSREKRPGASRRSSRDTGSGQDETPSGSASPIKPSKSVHTQLSVSTTTRMPSNSSMGTQGATFRHTSLLSENSDSPVDDDEAQGDTEMQAYVHRRRTRRASSSGKKDDMADITAFPEDVSPSEPISQRGESPLTRIANLQLSSAENWHPCLTLSGKKSSISIRSFTLRRPGSPDPFSPVV